ncbi:hypothetical protein B9G55_01525 [Saccharibacillus sp. O16]|nr:hypothetical protein B9G55_01525 [Saccharibacillus sp. O16]
MSIRAGAVDQVLERLALENKSRFNAYFVAHASGQSDIDLVNDYLLMKAKFGALEMKVESICPNNHIDQTFKNNILPTHEIQCRFCIDGDNEGFYMPDPENTNVVFSFTSDYLEDLKKKHQKRLIAI